MALFPLNFTDNETLPDAGPHLTLGMRWNGGRGSMIASGTWDSATLILEYVAKGADGENAMTWVDVGISLTDDGLCNFELPPGWLRASTSGGGTIDLDVMIKAIYQSDGAP